MAMAGFTHAEMANELMLVRLQFYHAWENVNTTVRRQRPHGIRTSVGGCTSHSTLLHQGQRTSTTLSIALALVTT